MLTPTVTEALARDLGKGLARLDPADIERLGLKIGDMVELVGRRKTVGKLVPTYSAIAVEAAFKSTASRGKTPVSRSSNRCKSAPRRQATPNSSP